MTPEPSEESRAYRGFSQTRRERELLIAELARRQHGVVVTWQLRKVGFSQDDILRRAATGRLHRIYRGVYAVGYRKLTPLGHRMAAVLAYGPDAVISHQTAAALWGIGQPSYKIHVTTPTSKHSRPGIRAHTAVLDPEDVATHNGIPVTSVARTIVDLAGHRDETGLTNLIEDADRNELIDARALEQAMTRRPRAAGIRRLRAVLADYRGPADNRSKLERGFRALIGKAGLPSRSTTWSSPAWRPTSTGLSGGSSSSSTAAATT